jgi:hypothetical protein
MGVAALLGVSTVGQAAPNIAAAHTEISNNRSIVTGQSVSQSLAIFDTKMAAQADENDQLSDVAFSAVSDQPALDGQVKRGAGEMKQHLMPIVMAVSNALNMSPFEIAAQLQADKSLADIAKAQNVDVQKVKDAIQTSIKAQLADIVKSGKITQAQADKANQTVAIWVDDVVTAHKTMLDKFDISTAKQTAEQFVTPIISATTSTLHLTKDQLKAQLEAGKSLADIAKAQNVDVQQLKDAIQTSIKAQLADVVKSGKITQAQADKANQTVALWIDAVVTISHKSEIPTQK